MPPVWSDDRGYAYAAGQDESGEITVFVVSLNDVGFKVVDVAGDAEAPVAGAKVTLKANNGATASGTTDADGAVVIDITSVSTEVDYGKEGKRKRFDGEVFVEAGDGYRAFSVGRLRVDGGTGVQVPTRQLESPDEAYFERIGFDGWDVLYTENEFFSAVSNTETHVVSGILRAPGATRARVQLATVDKKRRFRHTRRAGVRTDGRTGLVFVQGGLPDARKRQGASGRRLLQPSLQGGQQLLLVWQRREGKDRQSASRHGLFSGFWPGKGTRHDDQRVELQIAFILADAAW